MSTDARKVSLALNQAAVWEIFVTEINYPKVQPLEILRESVHMVVAQLVRLFHRHQKATNSTLYIPQRHLVNSAYSEI